jgi:hypothetical protein
MPSSVALDEQRERLLNNFHRADVRTNAYGRANEKRRAGMPESKLKRGWLAKRREQKRVKEKQRGASAEAEQEQRNADKNFDPTAVARNAGKYFPS